MDCLVDSSAHLVLINTNTVHHLNIQKWLLPKQIQIGTAIDSESGPTSLTEWTKIKLSDLNDAWTLKPVCAIVTHGLCADIILSLSFLQANFLFIDPLDRTVIDKHYNFNLLAPLSVDNRPVPLNAAEDRWICERENKKDQMDLPFPKLSHQQCHDKILSHSAYMKLCNTNPVAAVREWIEDLVNRAKYEKLETDVKDRFSDVFQPMPHIDEMPRDTFKAVIKLKDTELKYRDAWQTLVDKHLVAGRIRPSILEYASPTFLVPKADPAALPWWVNDYRLLNANTVSNQYRMPQVNEILSDAGKGQWFST